jgi:hypothetical protein
MRTVFKNHGIRGIYKGWRPTIAREAGAFAAFFGAYEWAVKQLSPVGVKREDLPKHIFFLSGGFSGYFMWLPWFPIDCVKSKI